MGEWINNEVGPDCYCGKSTLVTVSSSGLKPLLWCFFHSQEAGATFPLPSERPENWPNLNDDEMVKLVDQGHTEHDPS